MPNLYQLFLLLESALLIPIGIKKARQSGRIQGCWNEVNPVEHRTVDLVKHNRDEGLNLVVVLILRNSTVIHTTTGFFVLHHEIS